jgi:hypothetical protein
MQPVVPNDGARPPKTKACTEGVPPDFPREIEADIVMSPGMHAIAMYQERVLINNSSSIKIDLRNVASKHPVRFDFTFSTSFTYSFHIFLPAVT